MTSKRRLRRKQCGKKIKHVSQAAAWAHITKLKQREPDAHLNPYRCRWCGAWHVGNVYEQRHD